MPAQKLFCVETYEDYLQHQGTLKQHYVIKRARAYNEERSKVRHRRFEAYRRCARHGVDEDSIMVAADSWLEQETERLRKEVTKCASDIRLDYLSVLSIYLENVGHSVQMRSVVE